MLAEYVDAISAFATAMPPTLYMLNQFIGRKQDTFTKYVVRIKCFQLYHLEQCSMVIRGEKEIKKCDNIMFPNHPRKQFRNKCGQPLMRKVVARSGKESLVPYKVYCYMPLKNSLERILQYPSFLDHCNAWRHNRNNALVIIFKTTHKPPKTSQNHPKLAKNHPKLAKNQPN